MNKFFVCVVLACVPLELMLTLSYLHNDGEMAFPAKTGNETNTFASFDSV